MKQTAVEWLEEKLNNIKSSSTKNGEIKFLENEFNGLLQQAKEMEREQQSYSEEEVIDFLQEMNDWPTTFEGKIDIREWFKQFKNK